MSITKEQILQVISEMSVMDVMQLISMIEDKFGISAQNISVPLTTPDIKDTTEEKLEFDVHLINIGVNKIAVIKTVRSIMGLGLKESKDLVESAPVVLKQGINRGDAEVLKKSLEDLGASVDIK